MAQNRKFAVEEEITMGTVPEATKIGVEPNVLREEPKAPETQPSATEENEVLKRFPEHTVLAEATPEQKQACWTPGRTATEARYMQERYTGRYAKGPNGDVIAID